MSVEPAGPPPQPEPPPQPWPPVWARKVGLFSGIALIFYETVVEQAEHLVVYAIAFALTGLPIARGIESLLDKIPGGGK